MSEKLALEPRIVFGETKPGSLRSISTLIAEINSKFQRLALRVSPDRMNSGGL